MRPAGTAGLFDIFMEISWKSLYYFMYREKEIFCCCCWPGSVPSFSRPSSRVVEGAVWWGSTVSMRPCFIQEQPKRSSNFLSCVGRFSIGQLLLLCLQLSLVFLLQVLWPVYRDGPSLYSLKYQDNRE